MNRDQRLILDALDALGWTRFRYAAKGLSTYERNGIVAIVRPCRTVQVARWAPLSGGDSHVEQIAHLDPLYGRGWYTRTARIVTALATLAASRQPPKPPAPT